MRFFFKLKLQILKIERKGEREGARRGIWRQKK
jgi:hypothetical protein